MTKQAKEREDARAKLRGFIKPGDTIYTILRHVSRSGMSRVVDAFHAGEGEPRWIGSLAARAIGERYDDKRQGVKMEGAGMDMGFDLVYQLAYALYPHYNCLGNPEERSKRCPSPDHVNPGPERDNYEASVVHKDGYALRHRWL
jgi:hypothetical protein